MAEAFKWDQRVFDQTLRRYLEVSSRTLPDALNAKGFFIGRGAVLATPRADAAKIKALNERRVIGTGTRTKNGVTKQITLRDNAQNTRAGRIIAARRRVANQPALKTSEYPGAVKKMIGGRLRSRSYLASGWLPGIKTLEAAVDPKYRRGAPRNDRTAKVSGRPKGRAVPATRGFKPRAMIENAIGASGKRSPAQSKALQKYGGPALERAFQRETASMIEYLNARMKPDAATFNSAQRR